MKTNRLELRAFQEIDLPEFIGLNANPKVMQFFPNCLNKQESTALFKHLKQKPLMWAVVHLKTQQFIGFIGLNKSEIVAPYLEILWRFDSNFWGNGYATEAAACVLSYAHPRKVMAFTAVMNTPSQNLMKRLNMRYVKTFLHPKLAQDHSLAPHVLYETFMTSTKL